MEKYELQQIANLSAKVAELDRKINFILDSLNLTYTDSPPPPEFPEVEQLLRNGDKLRAIKAYQMQTGAGFGDSKKAVDAIERQIKGK